MNIEELDNIQELIERKVKLAEVMGGLTSSDKKFIDLWNYAMNLQQERDKYKSIIDKLREYMLDVDYKMGWQYVNYLDDLLEEGKER